MTLPAAQQRFGMNKQATTEFILHDDYALLQNGAADSGLRLIHALLQPALNSYMHCTQVTIMQRHVRFADPS